MSFKRLRGVPLPYERQGQIYFTCRNYTTERKYIRDKIDRLCASAGGEYAPALKELLLSGRSVQRVADEFHVSPERLMLVRRRFYTEW